MRRVRGATARQVAYPGRLAPFLLLLAPFASAAATLEVEGAPLVLGRAEKVAVTIAVEEAEKAPPLRVAVSTGSFSAPERVKPGLYRAEYTPPRSRFPQVALAALYRDDGKEVELLRFPLHGVTRLPVKAEPGDQVAVEVEAQRFGPVAAGADGTAVVPLVVPPGAGEARVSIRGASTTSRKVKLAAPEGNRLLAVALRPGGPRGPVELVVAYDGGASREHIRVEPSAGTAAHARSTGALHTFRWTPPQKAPAEVSFAVAVDGDATSRATAAIALAPPPAPRRPEPRPAGKTAAPRPAPVPAMAAPAVPLAAATAPALAAAPAPRSFILGSRAGFVDARNGMLGPRAGLEVWSSGTLSLLPTTYGLVLSVGSGSRAGTGLTGRERMIVAPLALRLGWEARLWNLLVARAGGAILGAYAIGDTAAGSGSGFGHGAGAFLSAAVLVRSAEIFAEATWARVPVRTGAGTLEAGGIGVEAGVRVGLF
ncbi:MAG: hypothetical protein HZB56_03000 [Deltaproteobacteria bacterium]|nr:hypothetical protein [Deltaproteobacteria bacterium]